MLCRFYYSSLCPKIYQRHFGFISTIWSRRARGRVPHAPSSCAEQRGRTTWARVYASRETVRLSWSNWLTRYYRHYSRIISRLSFSIALLSCLATVPSLSCIDSTVRPFFYLRSSTPPSPQFVFSVRKTHQQLRIFFYRFLTFPPRSSDVVWAINTFSTYNCTLNWRTETYTRHTHARTHT